MLNALWLLYRDKDDGWLVEWACDLNMKLHFDLEIIMNFVITEA